MLPEKRPSKFRLIEPVGHNITKKVQNNCCFSTNVFVLADDDDDDDILFTLSNNI